MIKPEFNPRDDEQPLKFLINVRETLNARSNFCPNCVKLDIRRDNTSSFEVPFQSGRMKMTNLCIKLPIFISYPSQGCQREICASDLKVNAKMMSPVNTYPFVIGSATFLTLVISATNNYGDPAFRYGIVSTLSSRSTITHMANNESGL